MAKMKKVLTVPESTVTVRPSVFVGHGEQKFIQIVLDDGKNVILGQDHIDVNGQVLEGSEGTNHFAAIKAADVGTLMGQSATGITVRQLIEELTYGILIDRGVEDEQDWEADT